MDPVTQGTLGAAAALVAAASRAPFRWSTAAWMGALGGLAPDLDVLIRSAHDPLLNIEYHRHFTHSLAFIPIGGALAALPWFAFARFRAHAGWTVGLTTLGYATHGLLDALTTYGTLLLWPFSDYRVSWHVISVIDPSFTLPLLALVIISARCQSRKAILGGWVYALAYLLFCFGQHLRADEAQARVAQRRGHAPERALVLPSFANNVTWRSLYTSGRNTYIDKIRVTWTGRTCVSSGTTVAVVPPVDYDALSPEVARGERLLRWFASGWVGYADDDPTVLGDLRYSFSTAEANPIWGIRRLPPGATPAAAHDVEWVNRTSSRKITWASLRDLWFRDAADAECW